MNLLSTIPKFLQGYNAAKRYNRLAPEVDRLHAQGLYKEEQEVIRKGQKLWVETIADKLNIDFEVAGMENMPDKSPFMVYSNHQGFADIPAILWVFKDHYQMGFVAKEEWRRFKVLSDAITYTRSIFLTRGSGRDAVKSLNEAKELLSEGFNLSIFPEGTRSQGHEMGEFKPGAFKFAEKAGVPIAPLTIDGSYKLFEEKGSYQPCHIKLTLHPLVHIEKMSKAEQKETAGQIEATIKSAL